MDMLMARPLEECVIVEGSRLSRLFTGDQGVLQRLHPRLMLFEQSEASTHDFARRTETSVRDLLVDKFSKMVAESDRGAFGQEKVSSYQCTQFLGIVEVA